MSYTLGIFAALLSALAFACIGLFVVFSNDCGINTYEVTYYRGITQFVVTLLYDIFEIHFLKHCNKTKNEPQTSVKPNTLQKPLLNNTDTKCCSDIAKNSTTISLEMTDPQPNSEPTKNTNIEKTALDNQPKANQIEENQHCNHNETELSFFGQLRLVHLILLKYKWQTGLKYMILCNCFSALSVSSYYYSLTYLSLGNAIAVYNIFPAFAFIFSYLFENAIFSKHQYIILFSCILGVIFVAQPTFLFGAQSSITSDDSESKIMIGYGISIFGAITQAAGLVSTSKLKNYGNKILLITLYLHSIALFIAGMVGSCLIYHTPIGSIQDECKNDYKSWLYLNIVGPFGFIGVVLLNYSLLHLPASYASELRSFDVIFGYIFQLTVLKDTRINIFTILGVSTISVPIGAYTVWKTKNDAAMVISKIRRSFDTRGNYDIDERSGQQTELNSIGVDCQTINKLTIDSNANMCKQVVDKSQSGSPIDFAVGNRDESDKNEEP